MKLTTSAYMIGTVVRPRYHGWCTLRTNKNSAGHNKNKYVRLSRIKGPRAAASERHSTRRNPFPLSLLEPTPEKAYTYNLNSCTSPISDFDALISR